MNNIETTRAFTSDDLKIAAFNGEFFETLVDRHGIDELYEGYREFATALHLQLQKQGGYPGDKEWRKKISRLLTAVNNRAATLRKWIKATNKAETATVNALDQKWREFAWELVTLLHDRDPEALRKTTYPMPQGDGSYLSGLEWYEGRSRSIKKK